MDDSLRDHAPQRLDQEALKQGPQGAPQKITSRRRRWAIPFVAALVLALGLGTWYGVRTYIALSTIQRADFDAEQGQRDDAPEPAQISPFPDRPAVAGDGKGLNFALMGVDLRSGEAGNGRSDSLMLAHVKADGSKLYLISFTRDSYVDIPGHGKGKINWAYQWGGPSLSARTLEQIMGVGVNHTAKVDFDGLIGLTEAVDGVIVNNPNSFSAGGFDFPKGPVELKGEKALAFVRERKKLPAGDLSRAANQRLVVQAIITKALKPEVIANPAKFDALLNSASKIVTVDQSLTNNRVRELATAMHITSSSDIVMLQAPITGFSHAPGAGSINVVDEVKTKALAQAVQDDTIDEYIATYGQR